MWTWNGGNKDGEDGYFYPLSGSVMSPHQIYNIRYYWDMVFYFHFPDVYIVEQTVKIDYNWIKEAHVERSNTETKSLYQETFLTLLKPRVKVYNNVNSSI